MATPDTATVVTLHQPKAKTPAERAKAYRDRKRQKAEKPETIENGRKPVFGQTGHDQAPVTPINVPMGVTPTLTPSRRPIVTPSRLLTIAAFGLAAVGVTMNGWFARSLGSSDIAGWLFLAIGVAADVVALAIPSCAASQWAARRRGTATAAWLVWGATFAFAVMAGVGFASVNISDVTTSRASRVTPAVTAAQASLSDAMTSRDRECAGGVGRNCRAREEAVTDRRRALDAAMLSVEHTADPQIEAASRIVAWTTGGLVTPTDNDFAMLRLMLLALLPQIGGILLMIGRH
jgi:hypothetical protein